MFSFSLSWQHPEKPHCTCLWRRHAHHRVSLQDVCDRPISFLWTTCSQSAFVPFCTLKRNWGGGHRMHFPSCYRGILSHSEMECKCEIALCFSESTLYSSNFSWLTQQMYSQNMFSHRCRKCSQNVRIAGLVASLYSVQCLGRTPVPSLTSTFLLPTSADQVCCWGPILTVCGHSRVEQQLSGCKHFNHLTVFFVCCEINSIKQTNECVLHV